MPERETNSFANEQAIAQRLDALGARLRDRESVDPPAALIDALRGRTSVPSKALYPYWIGLAASLCLGIGLLIASGGRTSSVPANPSQAGALPNPSSTPLPTFGAIASMNRDAPASEIRLPAAVSIGVESPPRASDVRLGGDHASILDAR